MNDFDMNSELGTRDTEDFKWRVLIVDDERDVHATTKLLLKNQEISGYKLEVLHAYSGEECVEILSNNSDIAVVLMDVIMENDRAGLLTVEHIRNVIKNDSIRIIVITGQPGVETEDKIVKKYDINGYCSKPELTSQKLYSLMHTAINTYSNILTIVQLIEDIKNEKDYLSNIINFMPSIIISLDAELVIHHPI